MTVFNGLELILLIVIIGLLLRKQTSSTAVLRKPTERMIMDSCALIDGRIIAITEAGFAAQEIIIPQFIINELQYLADGNDTHKRERARFGLDVAQQLQANPVLTVTIEPNLFPDIKKTDDKLIALAKKTKARLNTTDFNLNKVAVLAGVKVLNVNELSHSMRPEALPGETKMVKIIQKGQGRDQGVGYLDDGTMVVVDAAAKLQGKLVEVTVERMHQTVAGKMVFAHLAKRG